MPDEPAAFSEREWTALMLLRARVWGGQLPIGPEETTSPARLLFVDWPPALYARLWRLRWAARGGWFRRSSRR